MHELSIAEALAEQVRRHIPAGMRVSRIRLEIGPRQAVEEDALRFAWQAVVKSSDLDTAVLEIVQLPWTLVCRQCNQSWTSIDPLQGCPGCGSEDTQAGGSSDLRLLSLDAAPDFVGKSAHVSHTEVWV